MPVPAVHNLRRAAFCVLALALTGCGVFDRDELFLRPSQYEARSSFQPMPLARAWIAPQGARGLLQRPIYNGYEQRLSLQNPTSLPGDNQIVLRVRDDVVPGARLVFEEYTKWTGGLPTPFEDLEAGQLIQAEDDLGRYFYAEHRSGADTICVFALRRIDNSQRYIPAGGDVMDVQLRNCIRGTPEQALAPIQAASLSGGPAALAPTGGSRLLSPLAGPGL